MSLGIWGSGLFAGSSGKLAGRAAATKGKAGRMIADLRDRDTLGRLQDRLSDSRGVALAREAALQAGGMAQGRQEREGLAALVPPMLRRGPAVDRAVAVRAARRLNRAAGTIAASVLFDSAIEHYRGDFHNKAMYTPIAVSLLSLAASVHGHGDRRHGSHLGRDALYATAGLTGIVGSGFHAYNVGKRAGGFSWQNLFYAAPLGAPAALSLSGMLGFLSERVRNNKPGTLPVVLGSSAGRAVAALTALGLLGTSGEAGLLHFRGAYHNPFMLTPVTVPPVAAALLVGTATGPARTNRHFTRWWLRLTALVGFAGVAFHCLGVARNMGGWRNWTQNIQNGPPIPAPPAFTGLALAGLAALGLLEDHPDD